MDDPLMSLILHPATWLVALVAWIAWWWQSRRNPYIFTKFDRKRNAPGDLTADGSAASSKDEMRVRNTIRAAGYRPLPQGTGLVVAGRDANGNRRRLTPDIIIVRPRKIIVESDPLHWHGKEGPHKIYEDIERNKQYSALGYAVIRVRTGWEGQPYARLGKFDVVTKEAEFYPSRHATALARSLRQAKPMPTKYWDAVLSRLKPFHDQHGAMKKMGLDQPPQPGYGPMGGYGAPGMGPGQTYQGW